jgi:hypothetical protein
VLASSYSPIDYLVINTVNNFGMNIFGSESFRPVMPNQLAISSRSIEVSDLDENENNDIVTCIPDELDTWHCRDDR